MATKRKDTALTTVKKNDTMNKDKISPAHEQADKDIEQDPDLTSHSNPEDELDEGELARLEGED